MLTEILILPCVVWFAVTFAITPAITMFSKKQRNPIKPFECVFCLCFWVSLIYFVAVYGWETAPVACSCAIIGALIDKNV